MDSNSNELQFAIKFMDYPHEPADTINGLHLRFSIIVHLCCRMSTYGFNCITALIVAAFLLSLHAAYWFEATNHIRCSSCLYVLPFICDEYLYFDMLTWCTLFAALDCFDEANQALESVQGSLIRPV